MARFCLAILNVLVLGAASMRQNIAALNLLENDINGTDGNFSDLNEMAEASYDNAQVNLELSREADDISAVPKANAAMHGPTLNASLETAQADAPHLSSIDTDFARGLALSRGKPSVSPLISSALSELDRSRGVLSEAQGKDDGETHAERSGQHINREDDGDAAYTQIAWGICIGLAISSCCCLCLRAGSPKFSDTQTAQNSPSAVSKDVSAASWTPATNMSSSSCNEVHDRAQRLRDKATRFFKKDKEKSMTQPPESVHSDD